MKGKVHVHSELNKGTVFVLEIPVFSEGYAYFSSTDN